MSDTEQTNFDVLKYDEHGARYGIAHARFGLDNYDDPTDPYGVVIEYFDKKTKQQGTVRLMHSQVDVGLWPALNDAINLILTDALEKAHG